jgi:glycosyltransferase involved in cell wall biosynthesis
MRPKISILITTRNRAEHLRETLASFQRLHVPADLPAELLVVDNASTDDTAEVVRQCKLPSLAVRYLHEPKPGQSNARNSGMANTSGEVILFTDDDVRVPANWIEAMATPILGGEADAVAGAVKIAPHLARSWMTGLHFGWLASTVNLDFNSPGALVGANMAFSRMVLDKVPGFDPELGPGALGFLDETLFAKQIAESGLRISGRSQTEVEHHFDPERLTRPSWIGNAMKRGRSQAYFAYHWEHATVRNPRFHLVLAYLRLAKWRFLNRRCWQLKEGCQETELCLLRQTGFFRQYRAEMRRRRNYSKHGLVKLQSN